MQFVSVLSHYNPILFLVLLFRHVMETESRVFLLVNIYNVLAFLLWVGKQIEL